jgi:trans-aconitate methyltransferase
LSEIVCGAVSPGAAPARLLDIGCGTGDQLFDLAARLPHTHLVGVDISDASIASARRRQAADPAGARLEFHAADYLAYAAAARFDVLVSYSVLQFVPTAVETIAARIAADAAPGACFVNVMPYRCAYNHVLTAVRRAMRAIRAPLLDRAVLRAAGALHGRSMDGAMLAERLAYAYAVPDHFDEDLASALESRGFRTERRERVSRASPGQMTHALRVMRAPS